MKFSNAAVDAVAKGSKLRQSPKKNLHYPWSLRKENTMMTHPRWVHSSFCPILWMLTVPLTSSLWVMPMVPNLSATIFNGWRTWTRFLPAWTSPPALQNAAWWEQLCSGPVLTTFKDHILQKQTDAWVARAWNMGSILGNHDPTAEN